MSLRDIESAHLAAAIGEFDRLGRAAFLSTYGFGQATTYLLNVNGRLYDPKAIVGVAHKFTAAGSPLAASEFDATTALARLRSLGYDVVPFSGLWWVNQGASYRAERDGGYLWAPSKTRGGVSVAHHTDVTKLRVGQLIVCYSNGAIRAIGVVAGEPRAADRPAELSDDAWGTAGNLCPVDYAELPVAIEKSEIPNRGPEVGPFDRDGNVKQGYLYRIDDAEALPLLEFLLAREPQALSPTITHPHAELHSAPTSSPSNALAALVAEFRKEMDYPGNVRAARQAEREELAAALTMDALDAPDLPLLRRLAGSSYGSPGPQPGFNTALKDEQTLSRLVKTLRHLLYGPGDIASRIDDCLSGDYKIRAVGEAMLVKSLAVTDPSRWVPCYPTAGKVGKLAMLTALGHASDVRGLSAGLAATRTNDELRALLAEHFPDDPWGMQEFGWWLLHRERVPVQEIDGLATELLLPVEFLERILLLLEDRGQVVFYGPPGTGKTFVARKLAGYIARGGGTVEKIQFHASYAYEDFVEGYRPQLTSEGQLTYKVIDGPIKRLAEQARQRPDVTHVLLIDELNRANVSRVLGELLFLLEYRDEEIRLQYSEEPFALPPNLQIIATMNTADRSIALVDTALRRRFHFVGFFPDQAPIDQLLRQWLAAHKPDMMWVADVVDRANKQLGDRNSAIGPSHFLTSELSPDRVDLIWSNSVLPFLEEQFFNDPVKVEQFELRRLRDGRPTVSRAEGSAQPTSSSDHFADALTTDTTPGDA